MAALVSGTRGDRRCAALLLARQARARAPARFGLLVLVGGWALLAGLAGLVLAGLWGLTDHVMAYRNENLLQVNPLALLVLPGVFGAAEVPRAPDAFAAAAAVAALSCLGLLLKALPGFDQANGQIIALALPAQLGIAGAMGRLRGRPERAGPARPARTSVDPCRLASHPLERRAGVLVFRRGGDGPLVGFGGLGPVPPALEHQSPAVVGERARRHRACLAAASAGNGGRPTAATTRSPTSWRIAPSWARSCSLGSSFETTFRISPDLRIHDARVDAELPVKIREAAGDGVAGPGGLGQLGRRRGVDPPARAGAGRLLAARAPIRHPGTGMRREDGRRGSPAGPTSNAWKFSLSCPYEPVFSNGSTSDHRPRVLGVQRLGEGDRRQRSGPPPRPRMAAPFRGRIRCLPSPPRRPARGPPRGRTRARRRAGGPS